MKELGVIILNWNGIDLLKNFIPTASRHTVCDRVDLFNDTATTEIFTLSLHHALPI